MSKWIRQIIRRFKYLFNIGNERRNDYARNWSKVNPDKKREYFERCRLKHPRRWVRLLRIYQKNYRMTHKVKIKRDQVKYRLTHKAQTREYNRLYRERKGAR